MEESELVDSPAGMFQPRDSETHNHENDLPIAHSSTCAFLFYIFTDMYIRSSFLSK